MANKESGNDMMLGAEFVNRPRIQGSLGRLAVTNRRPAARSQFRARRAPGGPAHPGIPARAHSAGGAGMLRHGQHRHRDVSSDGSSVAELLRHADMALHVVKSQGRNEALLYQAHYG